MRVLLAGLLAALVAGGCSGTREIETLPPQPRATVGDGDGASAQEAPFVLTVVSGSTGLPEEVSELRFRITEVMLRRTGGAWLRLPSDVSPLVIERGQPVNRRTLLDTRITPGSYDSLAVSIADVYVEFGENAGAPLSTSADVPQRIAVDLNPALGSRTTVSLAFEPGASLYRSPECRWFFVPVLKPDVSQDPGSPAPSQ